MAEKVDVIIIGTTLAHSILAAALSHSGREVLLIDSEPEYGRQNGSFNLINKTSFIDNVIQSE